MSRESSHHLELSGLAGVWRVHREAGVLPPLFGVRKHIAGSRGWTTLGPIRVPFDVVGHELRYRAPLRGFVDVIAANGGEWRGRALVAGRQYGRFRLTRA